MKRCMILTAALTAGILVLGLASSPALQAAERKGTVGIKTVPLSKTQTWMLRGGTSGRELYREFCASCHGANAHGEGAAAAALSFPPTDLTRLAGARGDFPFAHVVYVLMSPCDDPHHRALDGTQTMPCWKRTLHDVLGSDGASYAVTYRLARYLESVQE